MSYLLDSVILIDHCNGMTAASRFLSDNADALAVSAITRAEVLAGFTEEQLPLGTALLDSFRFLPMNAGVADTAARLRRQTRLKLPDAIQAAFAIQYELRLATRDTKDLSLRQFDFVTVPYRMRQS